MGWKFNSTRIYVQQLETSNEQIIARLQPLDTGTVLHIFGYDSEKLNLGGLIITTTDEEALVALSKTGLSYTLSGPEGNLGDWFVKSVKTKRNDYSFTKLFDRPLLGCEEPTYQLQMELYIDE